MYKILDKNNISLDKVPEVYYVNGFTKSAIEKIAKLSQKKAKNKEAKRSADYGDYIFIHNGKLYITEGYSAGEWKIGDTDLKFAIKSEDFIKAVKEIEEKTVAVAIWENTLLLSGFTPQYKLGDKIILIDAVERQVPNFDPVVKKFWDRAKYQLNAYRNTLLDVFNCFKDKSEVMIEYDVKFILSDTNKEVVALRTIPVKTPDRLLLKVNPQLIIEALESIDTDDWLEVYFGETNEDGIIIKSKECTHYILPMRM